MQGTDKDPESETFDQAVRVSVSGCGVGLWSFFMPVLGGCGLCVRQYREAVPEHARIGR